MIRALYSAASGMTAQQMNVDNIANNLANANTVGYKTRRAEFQDLMYQSMLQPGAAAGQQTIIPTGLQLGLGTRASSNEIVFSQGSFSEMVEATKDIQINSEHQTIVVRGVVRAADIDATNSVQSNRLGELEVRVNGKGVVGDAIRRPFFLYRLLLGLLPF